MNGLPFVYLAFLILLPVFLEGQTITPLGFSNQAIGEVLSGRYNPADYPATDSATIDGIICLLRESISPDTMQKNLEKLVSFHNRNTYSDTTSPHRGIGAAQRWAIQRFRAISRKYNNRLLPAFFEFEVGNNGLCGGGRFKNVVAVLPGYDTADYRIVLIEAHMDSRCEDPCDTGCFAPGADDNGSGTVLVMELARVLSRFSMPATVVFMLTTGEEQGLYGATAFAMYASDQQLPVRAVLNNDIVGGIYCGQTASPPGCNQPAGVDSTTLRVFSAGNFNSPHKALARFVKLNYTGWLTGVADPTIELQLMDQEDRSGRGGDHIPFRQRGFPAIRFTEANEHGDGNPADTSYHDRQHTSRDVIGVDTDGDNQIDSFFVHFNYLSRVCLANGIALVAAAHAPSSPQYHLGSNGNHRTLVIEDSTRANGFIVGIRTAAPWFDGLYRINGSQPWEIPVYTAGVVHRISVASVDSTRIISWFGGEKQFTPTVLLPGNVADTLRFDSLSCDQTTGTGRELHTPVHRHATVCPVPAYRAESIYLRVPDAANTPEYYTVVLYSIVNGRAAVLEVRGSSGGFLKLPGNHFLTSGMYLVAVFDPKGNRVSTAKCIIME